MTTQPIAALIIAADDIDDLTAAPELATIEENLPILQRIVGGALDTVTGWGREASERVLFWRNETPHHQAVNYSATLLWHLYEPTAIGRDYLWGTVIVTGGPDPDQHIQPVPEDVIAHYAALRAMLRTADTL